jgi:hypothetical protein
MTTQLLSSSEFCKLRYDTTPVKSASANVSFYTNNSKMPNFELWHPCRKWAKFVSSFSTNINKNIFHSSKYLTSCTSNACRFVCGVCNVTSINGKIMCDDSYILSWILAFFSLHMTNHLILCTIHYVLSLILAIPWANNIKHPIQILFPFNSSIKPDLVGVSYGNTIHIQLGGHEQPDLLKFVSWGKEYHFQQVT